MTALRSANGAASHVRAVASPRRRLAYSDLGAAFKAITAERKWTIEGAIEGNPIVLIVGPEKKGKSWALVDLARVVTLGGSWLGRFPARTRGAALMIDAGENDDSETARRLSRLLRGHGEDPRALCRADGPVRHYWAHDLFLDAQNEALQNLLQDVREDPPAIITIDPFRNVLVGDENSAADVIEAMRLLGHLRDVAQCPIVIAHHVNKGGTSSGSRALATRADLLIEATDEDEPVYSTRGRKVRTRDAIMKRFTLDIPHEDDADDTIATTMVLARVEGEKDASGSRARLTKSARQILDALKDSDAPASSNALGKVAKISNGKVRSRALAELRSLGLAEVDAEGKWSVSRREKWNDTIAEMSADGTGGQDADHPY